MSTMNTVIGYVDGVKPNACTDEDKYRWINQLEGMLSTDVFHDPEPLCHAIPDDADAPLRLEHPWEELYALYVMAMIDFHNQEFGSYNNAMLLFRTRLEQLKAWHLRSRPPQRAAQFRKIMG